MDLRLYQNEACAAVRDGWAEGLRRLLLVIATGGGKTVVFTKLAAEVVAAGKRVMILAHRDELIRQAAAKVRDAIGFTPAIEKAAERANEQSLHGKAPVVVSSIQSQISGADDRRRMHKFNPTEFGLIIVDEAHHSTADSYLAVVNHYLSNPECRLLGVTATPDRNDDRNLGMLYERCVYEYQLWKAIADGYLVKPRQRSVILKGVEFSKVPTRRTPDGGTDFVEAKLAPVMAAERPVHQVVSATIELTYGLDKGTLLPLLEMEDDAARRAALRDILAGRPHRRTLIFGVGVDHAALLADVLNRWLADDGGPALAATVNGKTDAEVRRQIFRDFATGARPFLTNCQVATEGFDEPRVEVLVLARPTKSRSLLAQMVGRGTRPVPEVAGLLGQMPDAAARRAAIAASGKPHVEVLDFTDNSRRHDLVTAVDLLAPDDIDPAVLERAKEIAEDGENVDAEAALAEAEGEVKEKQRQAREQAKADAAKADAAALLQLADHWRRSLVGVGNYEVSEDNGGGSAAAGAGIVKGNGASEKQVEFLVNLGVKRDTATGYSKRQASAVIEDLKAKRCTVKQAKVLRRAGYAEPEIAAMNFDAAGGAITELAANNWIRPSGPKGDAA